MVFTKAIRDGIQSHDPKWTVKFRLRIAQQVLCGVGMGLMMSVVEGGKKSSFKSVAWEADDGMVPAVPCVGRLQYSYSQVGLVLMLSAHCYTLLEHGQYRTHEQVPEANLAWVQRRLPWNSNSRLPSRRDTAHSHCSFCAQRC